MMLKLEPAAGGVTGVVAEPEPKAQLEGDSGTGVTAGAAAGATGTAGASGAPPSKGAKPALTPFAALLEGVAVPLQNKAKLAMGDAATTPLGPEAKAAPSGVLGDKKKGARAAKKDDANDAGLFGNAGVPAAQRPLATAIALTISLSPRDESMTAADGGAKEPSGDSGAGGFAAGSEANANGLPTADANALGAPLEPNAAPVNETAPNPDLVPTLPRIELASPAMEPVALTDAKNGLSRTSGVHPTAKAISAAETQVVAAARSTTAQAYAAVASRVANRVATGADATSAAEGAASAHESTRKDAGANDASNASNATNAKEHASPAAAAQTSQSRGGDAGGGQSDARDRPDDPRGNDNPKSEAASAANAANATGATSAGASTKAASASADVTTSFTLAMPTHAAPTITIVDAPTKAEPPTRARFADDTLASVEKAAQSGQARTDFEVRAFDGTRVAVRVQVEGEKVHVGFSFDAKHTAAEETVRATVGSLESRLGERGLSTVVSFGVTRAGHENAVAGARDAGAGADATMNGGGHGQKSGDDPRERVPLFSDVMELSPARRAANGTGTPPGPPGPPNGRGWVA